MQIALRAAGGKPGDAVQTNSIALAPVPGAGSGVGARSLVARLAQNGVDMKWVGAPEPAEFMSSHRCWRYTTRQESPVTDEILAGLFDMRLPLTFGLGECDLIADHILQQVALLGAQA